jgi:hypothetical protein
MAPISRACRRSIFARPYIWRFTSFSFVICPSVWPLDQGSVMAARTAALSLMMPLAKEAIRLKLAVGGDPWIEISDELLAHHGLKAFDEHAGFDECGNARLDGGDDESLTLSITNSLGTSDEIRIPARMALIPPLENRKLGRKIIRCESDPILDADPPA